MLTLAQYSQIRSSPTAARSFDRLTEAEAVGIVGREGMGKEAGRSRGSDAL